MNDRFVKGQKVLARLPSTAWTESSTQEGEIVGKLTNNRWLVKHTKPGWKPSLHEYAERNLSLIKIEQT